MPAPLALPRDVKEADFSGSIGPLAGALVSGRRKAIITLLTLLVLATGYYVANGYGDLSMRPGEAMGEMPGMPMPGTRCSRAGEGMRRPTLQA